MKLNVTQLVLMETGTYDQMLLRPYEAKDGTRELATLQEKTRFGKNVTPAALSSVVGDILRPMADPIGKIQIANGWGTRRYRFFMRLTIQDMRGYETEQYLTGHTDYDGGSFMTGNIDPQLRFYINQSIKMQSILQMQDFGRQSICKIESAQHVFTNQFYPGMEDMANRSINLQRPQDVFTTLQASEKRRISDTFFDPRSTFAQESTKLSKRQNAVAPTYLSSVIKSSQMAHNNTTYENNPAEIWQDAEGYVAEKAYTEDSVLFELKRNTSFSNGDSFTFSELMGLCPHLLAVTRLVTPAEMRAQQTQQQGNTPVLAPYQAGQHNGWQGQDIYTVWASILSNSIPPLMLECMLANVGFTVHNHTLDGSCDVNWFYAQPFGKNLDGKQLVDTFGFRMIHEMLPVLRGSNPMSFSIVGHFDVLGESRMDISINGEPPVPFATPTFADALFSPVVTVGQTRVQDLSDRLEFYTDNLAGNGVDFPTQHGSLPPSKQPSLPSYDLQGPTTPYFGGTSRATADTL